MAATSPSKRGRPATPPNRPSTPTNIGTSPAKTGLTPSLIRHTLASPQKKGRKQQPKQAQPPSSPRYELSDDPIEEFDDEQEETKHVARGGSGGRRPPPLGETAVGRAEEGSRSGWSTIDTKEQDSDGEGTVVVESSEEENESKEPFRKLFRGFGPSRTGRLSIEQADSKPSLSPKVSITFMFFFSLASL
ncbi:hypothetical protein T439DRAFT_50030 [Meredithblackwellia eburnea MCA 4105]